MNLKYFLPLLQIAFIVLKIMDYLEWSWLWVLSPIWISCVLGAIGLAVYYYILTRKR